MKILVISSYLPYPLHSGGHIRLYNLIKELSKKHEITLICEKRLHQTMEDIQEMEKICKKVVTVNRGKQWSVKNIAKTATSLHSFLVTGHTHQEMKQMIMDELVRDQFDLIHVETFYVMQNLPKISLPVVLVDHNIEYQVYKRFVEQVPKALRPLLALDILKIKRDEEFSWKAADKVIAVSQDDKKIMEQKGLKPEVISNGVNVDDFAFKVKSTDKSKMRKILFIGDFKWIQNRDSVQFIIDEIWDKISLEANAKLWIVGRSIPTDIKNLTDDPDVIFDEKSSEKSAPEIFQEADVLLSPIRVGGGTSYKILEAMSCGTPVVTMPMSASAIHAKDGENIVIGENVKELAEKTIELLKDEKLFAKIAKNGRQLIEENYSWKKIAIDLGNIYKGVVK
ncbi:glycosyltransferase family 4 protein [Candidatus Roizmanbacteria bacterium]|nr:glycosyltransferase family 4 protein [Candidatus Roizmanbacteria bacterium]